ncbi:MAG: ferredoxin [Oscillospiraceae bacterium]|nr:ferredoxin [Oscillospiraceae bacterium]
MKASVNTDGCISCALCVDVCPKVFHFNGDGKSEAIAGDIPDDSVQSAENARNNCPVSVIDIH